ncbi:restriction endonuclease subunit S [Streptomyces sp. NPDC090445]|uniref:restriction endonuclease subunit S n=1 Tax=Streptomyces sp. NPDC090445 TaxID=3365963 RepID=UPI0038024C3A
MSELVLGDSLELLIDNRGKNPPFTDSGIPVLSAKAIKNGGISFKEARFISRDTYTRWMPNPLQKYDVILTSEAPLGECALVADNEPLAIAQRLYALRGKSDVLDGRYLYYALKFETVQADLHNRASGTTVSGIRQPELLKVRIPDPGYPQQKAIASALGALDNKIAVNEHIATTTDRLVSAMFSALIASRSAPGEVKISDVALVNSRSVKPKREGAVRYIDISSVGVGFYEWPDRIEWSDAPGRARRLAPAGSTVWSTVRPNRRSHALVLDADEDLVFSTGLAVLTPVSVGPAFLYEATRAPEFQAYLEGTAEGSAYPAVRADLFKEAPLPFPAPEEREKFEEAAMGLRQRAHQAVVESRTLAALRDTLLPQLMSGRLRVKDAERIVEDHV